MHEYGITSMLVDNIIDTAKKNGAKQVLSVEVEIGEFTFLNLEQVEFCYSTLISDTILEGSEIILRLKKGVVKCNSCDYMGPISIIEDPDLYEMRLLSFICPECNKTTRIIEGQEFIIRNIKMKR